MSMRRSRSCCEVSGTHNLRIVGEARKLGVAVSATSVRTILRRHGLGPATARSLKGPTWVEFLRAQAAGITAHPTGAWVTQQARNLVMELEDRASRFRFLVRDRDTKFTHAFDAVFTAAGVEILKIPPRSPRANAYAERWVRTARSACLDWILAWSDRHLHRVLTAYVAHYNGARPHRGLSLDIPAPPPAAGGEQVALAQDAGRIERIERIDVLGGLIHEWSSGGRPFPDASGGAWLA